MLADAIDFPIVAAFGIAVFFPLITIVTLIEWLIFRAIFPGRVSGTFLRLFGANTLSTMAGGVIYAFQNSMVEWSGIHTTMLAFRNGYRWVALFLIAAYFTKSVIVESLVVVTRNFASSLHVSRRRVFKGLILANVASYCVTGPLFYVATRPKFGHQTLLNNTAWSANSELPIYFIGNDDGFIQRISADGSGQSIMVPFPATAFLVSEDQTTFAYRGSDGNLYVYSAATESPRLIWKTQEPFYMDSVSLSPDNNLVAFAMSSDGEPVPQQVRVFNLNTSQSHDLMSDLMVRRPLIGWSRSGQHIFVQQDDDRVFVLRGAPPWEVLESKKLTELPPSEFPLNYVRSSDFWDRDGQDWETEYFEDSKPPYRAYSEHGIGGSLRIWREKERVLRVAEDYGLVRLFRPFPHTPTFLPHGVEVLTVWNDHLYLLDVERQRIGYLAPSNYYLAPVDRFRLSRRVVR